MQSLASHDKSLQFVKSHCSLSTTCQPPTNAKDGYLMIDGNLFQKEFIGMRKKNRGKKLNGWGGGSAGLVARILPSHNRPSRPVISSKHCRVYLCLCPFFQNRHKHTHTNTPCSVSCPCRPRVRSRVSVRVKLCRRR